ncbi:hypothetical protein KM043_004524 [Ampulex compressa]|nr:hypothetical protein KM043_004524 [Ampulex compressa]
MEKRQGGIPCSSVMPDVSGQMQKNRRLETEGQSGPNGMITEFLPPSPSIPLDLFDEGASAFRGFDLASRRSAPRGTRQHSPRKWTDGLEAARFHLEQNQNPVLYIPARSLPRVPECATNRSIENPGRTRLYVCLDPNSGPQ